MKSSEHCTRKGAEAGPEHRARFGKAPAKHSELLIPTSRGGIDFPKTYSRIQQVQMYRGLNPPTSTSWCNPALQRSCAQVGAASGPVLFSPSP